MNYYFSRAYYKLNKKLFDYNSKFILDTKPIEYRYDKNVIVLSMVHHAALEMYLVAIKSFLYYFCKASVHVLDDGSLTEEDKSKINHHIPNVVITHINDVDTTGFPKGGCWERLLHICELTQDAYVIQLDSDTLTRAPLFEVYDAIEHQRGFTITDFKWKKAVDVGYLANIVENWSKKWSRIHVQPQSEAIFEQLPFFEKNRKYIRGCSGFAGFPKNQISRDSLKAFSQQVSEAIGDQKWSEWGSEQVASNVMISQMQDALTLHWPLYINYSRSFDKFSKLNASFIHFIGSDRFYDRFYGKMTLDFIKLLKDSGY